MMKKAIVTGATGFIGSHLVKELISNKVEVIGVIRPYSISGRVLPENIKKVECELSDITNLDCLISDRDVDCVFHTAWHGIINQDARDYSIQLKNIQWTLDLVECAKRMNISTFVGCGSMHEAEAIVELSENKTIDNLGIMYKSAKTASHWMAKALAGKCGIRFFWPLINTYGEGEQSSRLVNYVIRSIFNGVPPKLSKADQYYDFVHVEDVVHALFLIAEKGNDGTNYVIGSGNPRPLKEYLILIGEVVNEIRGESPVSLGFGLSEGSAVYLPEKLFDISSLIRDTGFSPQIPFDVGIRRTAMWIYNNEFK